MATGNQEKRDSEYGKTVIANEVVAVIAGIAAADIEGVASMTSGLVDDISSSLGVKSSKRGVKVDLNNDIAKIDIYIVVHYGVKIPSVSDNLRKSVIDAVETMTGISVAEVNIYVQGVQLEKEPKNVPEPDLA